MNPATAGADATAFALSSPSRQDLAHDNEHPPADNRGRHASPRMLQPVREPEPDGMEVDTADDEGNRVDAELRPPKRGRESDDDSRDPHDEPRFKRPRHRTHNSPDRKETDGDFFPSSSSSSSSLSSTSSCATSGPTGPKALPLLSDTQVSGFWEPNKIDLKKAAAVIFEDRPDDWPDGFSLLEFPGLSPELADILRGTGMHVLWSSSGAVWGPWSLVLVAPQYDRERLKLGLLQVQINQDGTRPPQAELNADAEAEAPRNADAIDDDTDDVDEGEYVIHVGGERDLQIRIIRPREAGIEGGNDVQTTPFQSCATPLMVATVLGDIETLNFLLDNGADPNRQTSDGKTALMVAAAKGHIRLVRSLLRHPQTQTHLKDSAGWAALAHAAQHGHEAVFSLLLNFGMARLPRQVSDEPNGHPFIIAAHNGHQAICALIVAEGVRVDSEDNLGRTPLWYAAHNGHAECCLWLLEAGANLDHVDGSGNSILSAAVAAGKLDVFNLLLERGAALTNERQHDTLLNIATRNQQENLVRRLIELKVDINATGASRQTAITLACIVGSTAIAKLLLEAGANPDIPDSSETNTLIHAAGKGNVELMRLLLQFGAKLRSKENFGYLALYAATAQGCLEGMKLLLEAGVPTSVPRLRDSKTWSLFPLLSLPICSLDNYKNSQTLFDAIKLLLKFNTPLSAVDQFGVDTLMLAAMDGHAPLIELLFSAGASVGQADVRGRNALQIAAKILDNILTGAREVSADYAHASTKTLRSLAILTMQKQPYWEQRRAMATQRAEHPVTREILSIVGELKTTPSGTRMVLAVPKFETKKVFAIVKAACELSHDDWDPPNTEIQLCLAGARLPAIKAYCSFIDAFPAMKLQLFGPVPVTQIPYRLWVASLSGTLANTKRLIVDGESINELYKDLGSDPLRKILADKAGEQIALLSDLAAEQEKSLATEFAGLFDQCLLSTLSLKREQALELHASPPAQFIASQLTPKGIYAALADRIDQAWRAAWVETIPPRPESFLNSDHLAWIENQEVQLHADIPILDSTEGTNTADSTSADSSINGGTTSLSEQRSLQLLQAFRGKLSLIVDSGDTLKLPGASPEAAGLYADLMFRQLHMLTQFIKGETEVETGVETDVETVPVAAPSAVPAPAPFS